MEISIEERHRLTRAAFSRMHDIGKVAALYCCGLADENDKNENRALNALNAGFPARDDIHGDEAGAGAGRQLFQQLQNNLAAIADFMHAATQEYYTPYGPFDTTTPCKYQTAISLSRGSLSVYCGKTEPPPTTTFGRIRRIKTIKTDSPVPIPAFGAQRRFCRFAKLDAMDLVWSNKHIE